MNANNATVSNFDELEDIAAELTDAALPVALRFGREAKWLDLELGLWKALTDTIKKHVPEWKARSL